MRHEGNNLHDVVHWLEPLTEQQCAAAHRQITGMDADVRLRTETAPGRRGQSSRRT
jgi:hypothetical protein